MSATMTCTRCGATMTGNVAEVIKWDISHDEFCPSVAAVETPKEQEQKK